MVTAMRSMPARIIGEGITSVFDSSSNMGRHSASPRLRRMPTPTVIDQASKTSP